MADRVNPRRSFSGRFRDLLDNWRCYVSEHWISGVFRRCFRILLPRFGADWKQKSWKTGTNRQVKLKIIWFRSF